VEQSRDYDGHTVCLRCHETLTRNAPVTAFVKVTYAPYAWLKFPAILLGVVGLLGILIDTVQTVAVKCSLLNMPPRGSCYLITAGAIILLGIAILYKHSKEEIAFDQRTPQQPDENWRSV
jgi:hypothetical protein